MTFIVSRAVRRLSWQLRFPVETLAIKPHNRPKWNIVKLIAWGHPMCWRVTESRSTGGWNVTTRDFTRLFFDKVPYEEDLANFHEMNFTQRPLSHKNAFWGYRFYEYNIYSLKLKISISTPIAKLFTKSIPSNNFWSVANRRYTIFWSGTDANLRLLCVLLKENASQPSCQNWKSLFTPIKCTN